jgi:hypothetical protein
MSMAKDFIDRIRNAVQKTGDVMTGSLTIKAPEASATLGLELLSNGEFTGNATGWTLGTNWAYGANAVICTINGSVEGTLSQNISVVTGNYYLLQWGQTNSIDTNAQVTPSLGAVVGKPHSNGTTLQTYQTIFRATDTGSVALKFTINDITSTGTITIDNVSLKQITPMKASMYLPSTTAGENIAEVRTTWNGTNTANIGIGWRSLQSNTTGYGNAASGTNALLSNTTGYGNAASGNNALLSNTTGYWNTASGNGSLYNNTTGYWNTASGNNALLSNTTGYYNTASGVSALSSNTTFSNVSGLGFRSSKKRSTWQDDSS